MQIFNRSGRLVCQVEGVLNDALRGLHDLYIDGEDLGDLVFDSIKSDGAFFAGHQLPRASLRNVELYWPLFTDAQLIEADFEGSRLAGADFSGANLVGANCRNAQWGHDAFGRGCTLQRANFRIANWEGACFEKAEYDSFTKFPEGFDPEAHGMLFVENK